MKSILSGDTVYVKQSDVPGAGRGVFARRQINKGECIEKCPVIDIPAHDMAALSESILLTYFFFHGKNKSSACIALGFGSLYNHSYQPNAVYRVLDTEKMIEFTALTDIAKDTEITFNYKAGSPKNAPPLWFEAA